MSISEPRTGIPADTFANRLILARAQAGHISIREAAEKCGLGRGAWTNWEKGAKPEGFEDLTALIAEKLHCQLGWLRNGGALRSVDDRRPRWQRDASVRSTAYVSARLALRRSRTARHAPTLVRSTTRPVRQTRPFGVRTKPIPPLAA